MMAAEPLALVDAAEVTCWNMQYCRKISCTTFDLTFQNCFMSFPNENKRKTYVKCHPPWLSDEENFHSRSPKTALNGIF